MLKVRIVNERQKKKSIGKGDIRYARFFFLVRENFCRLRIDIYDIVDGWRRQTRLHGAWRHECNDIYVLRGSKLVRDWRRIADPGSSRRNATPGRPVTSPAAAIPYILISVPLMDYGEVTLGPTGQSKCGSYSMQKCTTMGPLSLNQLFIRPRVYLEMDPSAPTSLRIKLLSRWN